MQRASTAGSAASARAWVACGLLACPLWVAAEPLDLLAAYQRARAGDPVLRAAEATLRSVQEGVVQARAPLLPQAGAAVGLAESHGSTVGEANRTRTRDLTAGVSQVLLDVGQVARLSYARSRDRAEQASYRAAEQALCIRVATAYFGVLTAKDLLANTEAVEAAYLRQVEQADQRYRSGLVAMVDVDQARAYHASARGETIAARKALDDAVEALAEITGVRSEQVRTLRADLPLVPPQPDDPQAWVEAAWQANPRIVAQQRNLDAAGNLVDAARAGHLPTVSASLDVGRPSTWPGGESVGRDGRTVTTIGVLLRVPLFAGGLTQSTVRQAMAQRDAVDADLDGLRRRIARETLGHYSDLVAARGRIDASRSAMESAGKALASTRVGQQLGTQTMTDLLLAIQILSQAQNAHSEARHRYVLSQLLLKQAAGQVSEADLQIANGLLQ